VTAGAPVNQGTTGLDTPVTATASCPAGKVLLGGGAKVTYVGGSEGEVVLQQSYPSSATQWTAVGVILSFATGTMTVQAYVVCTS
jgi:hypothetical protein